MIAVGDGSSAGQKINGGLLHMPEFHIHCMAGDGGNQPSSRDIESIIYAFVVTIQAPRNPNLLTENSAAGVSANKGRCLQK